MERVTEEPPVAVAGKKALPAKTDVPEAVTPDWRAGVEGAETTNELPPLAGVLKAIVVVP